MIADDVVMGAGVTVHHPQLVDLYGCSIGEGTLVGPFVEVQRGAIIGARCKISSHSFVCTGVVIEDEVFVGHGVMFINDRVPRSVNTDGSVKTDGDWKPEDTVVRRGASLGSNVTVICGVEIGEGAIVGAGSVVTKDVRPGAIVAGNPARELKRSYG